MGKKKKEQRGIEWLKNKDAQYSIGNCFICCDGNFLLHFPSL
jgi:hypothetical protein